MARKVNVPRKLINVLFDEQDCTTYKLSKDRYDPRYTDVYLRFRDDEGPSQTISEDDCGIYRKMSQSQVHRNRGRKKAHYFTDKTQKFAKFKSSDVKINTTPRSSAGLNYSQGNPPGSNPQPQGPSQTASPDSDALHENAIAVSPITGGGQEDGDVPSASNRSNELKYYSNDIEKILLDKLSQASIPNEHQVLALEALRMICQKSLPVPPAESAPICKSPSGLSSVPKFPDPPPESHGHDDISMEITVSGKPEPDPPPDCNILAVSNCLPEIDQGLGLSVTSLDASPHESPPVDRPRPDPPPDSVAEKESDCPERILSDHGPVRSPIHLWAKRMLTDRGVELLSGSLDLDF